MGKTRLPWKVGAATRLVKSESTNKNQIRERWSGAGFELNDRAKDFASKDRQPGTVSCQAVQGFHPARPELNYPMLAVRTTEIFEKAWLMPVARNCMPAIAPKAIRATTSAYSTRS